MQLKRLLIVSEPGTYGVFHYVRDLIEFLHRRHPEATVDFAYSTRRGSPALLELVKRVEQHGGQTVDLNVGNAPAPSDLGALKKLRALIRAHRPDVIHANSSKAGGLCRLLKLIPGTPPVLYSPHAYFGMRGGHGPAVLMFNGIEILLGPLSRTLTYCADERDFGRRTLLRSRRGVVLIHHGIDLRRFTPATPAEKAAARASLGIPNDRPLLVTVGRHSFQKNFPALYAALDPLLARPAPAFRFAHAGDGAGGLAATLSPAARASVHSFEFLPDVERLLRAADAFVMASRYETLCLAVVEAAACGLKIFLSRVTGLSSYAQLGFDEFGWIEPADFGSGLTANLRQSFDEWFGRGAPAPIPLVDQVKLVGRWFDREVQLEKHWKLYRWLARAS